MKQSFDIQATPSLVEYVLFLIEQDVEAHNEISQNKAYRRFGRTTVERWVKDRRVKKYLRGENGISYKLKELLKASAKEQTI
jgi:hypothetical protein